MRDPTSNQERSSLSRWLLSVLRKMFFLIRAIGAGQLENNSRFCQIYYCGANVPCLFVCLFVLFIHLLTMQLGIWLMLIICLLIMWLYLFFSLYRFITGYTQLTHFCRSSRSTPRHIQQQQNQHQQTAFQYGHTDRPEQRNM